MHSHSRIRRVTVRAPSPSPPSLPRHKQSNRCKWNSKSTSRASPRSSFALFTKHVVLYPNGHHLLSLSDEESSTCANILEYVTCGLRVSVAARSSDPADAWVDLRTRNSGKTRVFGALEGREIAQVYGRRSERLVTRLKHQRTWERGAAVPGSRIAQDEAASSVGRTRKGRKSRKTKLVAWSADGTS